MRLQCITLQKFSYNVQLHFVQPLQSDICILQKTHQIFLPQLTDQFPLSGNILALLKCIHSCFYRHCILLPDFSDDAAEERAESSSQLAAEKEKTISTLAEKLSSAEEKGKKYDGLYESKKTAQEQIHALERTIKELEKDHATEKRELQSEAEQKLSAAQKDAALETLNAVAAKEREMNGQLLQLERENAKLQAKIELLEARLQQQP